MTAAMQPAAVLDSKFSIYDPSRWTMWKRFNFYPWLENRDVFMFRNSAKPEPSGD